MRRPWVLQWPTPGEGLQTGIGRRDSCTAYEESRRGWLLRGSVIVLVLLLGTCTSFRQSAASTRYQDTTGNSAIDALASVYIAVWAGLAQGMGRARPRVLPPMVIIATVSAEVRASAIDPRLNVYLTCDGGDVVGAHLCFAVKEKIITSNDLQLVDERTARTGIAVHLVSVDASPANLRKGLTSAVSVTYAFFGGPIEYYDGAQVFLVGAKKVEDISSAILIGIEKRATKLRAETSS